VSNNRLQLNGFAELREALRNLPAQLRDEAKVIVQSRAARAAQEIIAAYPERTGNLRKGVSVRASEAGNFGAGAIVVNRAKHAWIFENGTQARHTDIGANRGSMPPGHVFVPIVMRHRRGMYDELRDVLVRDGFVVTGNA